MWPSNRDKDEIDSKIFESNLNPFAIASYHQNQSIKSDFVGRKKELFDFKEKIKVIYKEKVCRAFRLEGPSGVGKSTLFNYLKEAIEEERASENPSTNYILKKCDIFSTYFVIGNKINNFSDIWQPMINGLTPGFEKELNKDISLPEYIIYNCIYQMFLLDRELLSEIIWKDYTGERPKNIYNIELVDIIEPLKNRGSEGVKDLQEYYKNYKLILRKNFKFTINENSYELKREDNEKIHNLFRVINEDDPDFYLESILNRKSEIFTSDNDLIDYFNDLMRYYTCFTKKQPILLIGIDEIAKSKSEDKEAYYSDLGLILVRLRDLLNYVLFVFISTSKDWKSYDDVIKDNTDLKGQLSDFIDPMVLSQLPIEDLIQVFRNRMVGFWRNYSTLRPPGAPYYPFSENLFEYIYRYCKRNLRDSIVFLRKFWNHFKFNKFIPKLETMFECMREVYKFELKTLDPSKFQSFEWKIINNSFNKPGRFSSNGDRSSAVETGLELAWECLCHESPRTVWDVRNNKTIRTSNSKKRRPDVLVELLSNLGSEYRRNIEFQVKMYKKNSTVAHKDIKSSIQLFNEKYTDYLYFIMTGGGLDSKAEAHVKELEKKWTNRIIRPILNTNQENALYFLALFEEISGKKLGANIKHDIKLVKDMLTIILGQNVDIFLNKIKNLPHREIEIEVIEDEESEGQKVKHKDQTKLSDFEKEDIQKKEKKIEQSQSREEKIPLRTWLKDYPQFSSYRNELCFLCLYFKDKKRETGADQFKFYPPTIISYIMKDVSLDKNIFDGLVKFMRINGFIINEAKSFRMTENGRELYKKIKADNYQC
ncbi:MAG: hypothetical protein JXA99_08395 [Candidatus Lokiarchaeota archaeon]|nr:hypothetical protein [Candidatus Lokiarchaeota archaeon]